MRSIWMRSEVSDKIENQGEKDGFIYVFLTSHYLIICQFFKKKISDVMIC